MTPKGKEFVERMDLVKLLIINGAKPFAAMAAALEETDWLLVYAAACKMKEDIVKQ